MTNEDWMYWIAGETHPDDLGTIERFKQKVKSPDWWRYRWEFGRIHAVLAVVLTTSLVVWSIWTQSIALAIISAVLIVLVHGLVTTVNTLIRAGSNIEEDLERLGKDHMALSTNIDAHIHHFNKSLGDRFE